MIAGFLHCTNKENEFIGKFLLLEGPVQTATVLNITRGSNRIASVSVCQHRKISIMCNTKVENKAKKGKKRNGSEWVGG